MKLSKIVIKNFRCFENIDIDFHSQMNVFVGINGVGKTAVLDAIATTLDYYLSGIGMKSIEFSKENIRIVCSEIGNTIDRQPQFPVELEFFGVIDNKENHWKRSWNRKSSGGLNATNKSDSKIDVIEDVKVGSTERSLPLIAYYGVDRVKWIQEKKESDLEITNRFFGYKNCLNLKYNDNQMISWFKKMTLQALQDEVEIPELNAVATAMKKCIEGIMQTAKNIEVRYGAKSSSLEISYTDEEGNRQNQPFSELSDGYRKTLSLVADIAYRMAVLNPQLFGNVIDETSGVVLIDEIDLHLHPSWQKRVLQDLMTIFPKVQFIVTTHSPSVIQSVKHGYLLILDGNKVYRQSQQEVYGRDFSSILNDIMATDERPEEIKNMFNEIYKLISNENWEKAIEKTDELKDILGDDDPDLTGISVTLDLRTLEV